MSDKNLEILAQELLSTILFFNGKGWSPATSTNYSVRTQNPDQILISRSGVDKSKFKIEDLIIIDKNGAIHPTYQKPEIKSSAETDIHTFLYQKFPDIQCVLHTHSPLGTVLSKQYANEKKMTFEGFEIQKGLEGNLTHDVRSVLPIVPNSQDMQDIIRALNPFFEKNDPIHGFLIEGHGLYSWGKNIATAKRHIETYEFLFECYHLMRRP